MSRFPRNRQGGTGSGIPSGSSSATAYWEAAVEYPTLVDGAVSDLPDIISTNNATQSTAANRPVLSRSDNRENQIIQSEDLTVSPWSASALAATLDSEVTPDGYKAFALTENAVNTIHKIEQVVPSFAGSTFRIRIVAKQSARNWIYISRNGGGADRDIFVNLATGTEGTQRNLIEATVTSLGDGWYEIILIGTDTSTNAAALVTIRTTTGDFVFSYLGANLECVLVGEFSYQVETANHQYLPTTSFRQYAGINGNAVPVFDGSNDSLATTIAVNPTGGMWGAAVIRPSVLGTQRIMAAWEVGNAGSRLLFHIDSSGFLNCYVGNGTANGIGRRSGAVIAANNTYVVSFTYDGGTAATGIKLYVNSVQVDVTTDSFGAYTVPTAGLSLNIGRDVGGSLFNGYLSPAVFGQGSTWADADRQATERDLMTKYIPNYVWFNPANNVTSSSGAVASWTDVTNTYVASQSTAANRPAVSTLNGQTAFLFDGTNDSLATSLAVNPTGGMAGVFVSNISSLAVFMYVFGNRAADTGDRISFLFSTDGSLQLRVLNGSANYIQRNAPAGTAIVNESAVWSWTYDGTTSATGIKVYKNGVQVDTTTTTAGAYTVPTAGNNLRLGQLNTGANNMNGYIADAFFVQGRQMSDSERQGWESRFMTQYGVV